MPKYTLKNHETGTITEMYCSYAEVKELESSDPNLSLVIGAPTIVSGYSVKDGGGRLPEGFKDKLRDIKKKHPDSSGVDHLI